MFLGSCTFHFNILLLLVYSVFVACPVHREIGMFVYLKNIYVLKFLRIILNNCIRGGEGINYFQFFFCTDLIRLNLFHAMA